MSVSDDLSLALRLADIADVLSMSRFRAGDLVVETKPDSTPVTEADKAVERALREVLAVERPADGVIGEEFGTAGDSDRTWIIDPIDGTKNYLRGVPVWATLIALRDREGIAVGVASAPAMGRRWWAGRGLGAQTSDPSYAGGPHPEPRALRVSGVARLEDASLSYSDSIGWRERGARLGELIDATWRQRAYGDFWSHLLVAEGAVDIAAEPALELYDLAALLPIVTEAGGRVSGYDGSDPLTAGSLVCTNSHLHEGVLAYLSQ